jgi:monovalent cation:H+ antiporter, CPA1 family
MLGIQVLFFLCLLLAGAMLHPLAERLRLPFSIILILIGFGASELVTSWGFDTGLRWYNFHPLILNVLLPVLIFQAALQLDIGSMRRYAGAIALLALPLMLLGITITAVFLYYGIAHPTGFPWVVAWLTAALLSATDSTAIVGLLRRVGADRLATILESEGLFNDATAIMLFGILVTAVVSGGDQSSIWSDAIMKFMVLLFGGLALGVAAGLVANLLLRLACDRYARVVITLVIAYATYLTAHDLLQVSGVMALLACGLVIGGFQRRTRGEDNYVQTFWGLAGFLAGSSIFLLAGITVNMEMFTHQWLAILIAIGAVLIARILTVLILLPLGLRWMGQSELNMRDHVVIGWGGVRGAVTLALALSLPLEVTSWYTLQSMAYGVVLFAMFIQASTLYPLVKWLLSQDRLNRL